MRVVPARPDHDGALAVSLVELQRRAYAVEASLIGDDRIPYLHQDAADLRAAHLQWLVAIDAHRIVGAIAWSNADEHAEIDRLIVEPEVHRRGIGRSLVAAAVQHIMQRPIVVSTGSENYPARFLYEAFGFTHRKDTEPLAGLWIAHYVRA